MTTANGVANRRRSSETPGRACRKPTMAPLSLSRSFQDSVRTRKLVKNGAMTAISMRFFQRPALNAIA